MPSVFIKNDQNNNNWKEERDRFPNYCRNAVFKINPREQHKKQQKEIFKRHLLFLSLGDSYCPGASND